VQTHAPEAMLLVLGMEIRFGDMVEQIQMAFPHAALEPILQKLNAKTENAGKADATRPGHQTAWNPALDDIQMRISAQWFGVELTAGQLAELKSGDVLPLAQGTASRVQVLIESTPRFLGNLGTCGQQWAVKLAETLAC
jgi:flagellar motor switch protein FliM